MWDDEDDDGAPPAAPGSSGPAAHAGPPDVDPMVALGSWSSDQGGQATPPGWVVLGVLLGLPAALILLVFVISH